jgi:uncharacterized protein YbjT (DUF2867 family)
MSPLQSPSEFPEEPVFLATRPSHANNTEDSRLPKLEVLVVGSTGRQGGAVARALLHGGHRVRALTRDLANPAADALRLRGARLAWADLDDETRMNEAVEGVDAIFAVTTPYDSGPDAETRRGLLLADLARRHGVRHFVYSSSVGSAQRTGVRVFDSKHEVEQCLRALSLPYTVVSPAFFMENLLTPRWLGFLQRGELSLPLTPGRKVQQVAVADIGRFVRLVMERRDEFLHRRVPIASDELTPVAMAATLARLLGRRVQHVVPDPTALRERNPDMAAMYEWLDDYGRTADVVRLRADYPEVNWHTLDGWATRQDWSCLDQPASA